MMVHSQFLTYLRGIEGGERSGFGGLIERTGIVAPVALISSGDEIVGRSFFILSDCFKSTRCDLDLDCDKRRYKPLATSIKPCF